MQHKADIGFIYAHAEGVCCNHDPLAVIDKIFLIFAAFLRGKARMITGGGNANGSQLLTDGLYRFAGSAIDNAAAIPVIEDIFFNITFFIPRAGHTKIEVGAIKAGGQRKGWLSCSRAMISCLTCSVAVAVNAPMTGRYGRREMNSAIFR